VLADVLYTERPFATYTPPQPTDEELIDAYLAQLFEELDAHDESINAELAIAPDPEWEVVPDADEDFTSDLTINLEELGIAYEVVRLDDYRVRIDFVPPAFIPGIPGECASVTARILDGDDEQPLNNDCW
jgi:hypothetical protein